MSRISHPFGYFVTDYESEIRESFRYLENKGLIFLVEDEFCIKYCSDELELSVVFERYGDSLFIEYILPKKNINERYSVIWMLMVYQNGELEEKYIKDDMSRVEEIAGYAKFFKDNMDILIDFETAEKLKRIYNSKEFSIKRWGSDTFFIDSD